MLRFLTLFGFIIHLVTFVSSGPPGPCNYACAQTNAYICACDHDHNLCCDTFNSMCHMNLHNCVYGTSYTWAHDGPCINYPPGYSPC